MRTFAIFITLFFASLAHAGPTITVETIQALIKDNRVQSVDELLPLLPKELLKNYSLVHHSRNVFQHASSEAPRVILFSEDGGFLMTFTSKAGVKGGTNVETITQRTDGKFEFNTMDFSKSRTFERQTTSCTACHGKALRPIWEPYPLWSSSYGSNHDILKDRRIGKPSERASVYRQMLQFSRVSSELRMISDLKKSIKAGDRLSYLTNLKKADYTHLANLNLYLSRVLVKASNRQWIAELKSHEKFKEYEPLLLSEFGDPKMMKYDQYYAGLEGKLGADLFQEYDAIRVRSWAPLKKYYEELGDRMRKLQPEFKGARDSRKAAMKQESDAIALIEWVGRKIGVNQDFFTITDKQGAPYIGSSGRYPDFKEFYFDLLEQKESSSTSIRFEKIEEPYPFLDCNDLTMPKN